MLSSLLLGPIPLTFFIASFERITSSKLMLCFSSSIDLSQSAALQRCEPRVGVAGASGTNLQGMRRQISVAGGSGKHVHCITQLDC
jgi:hypothetical protein